MATSADQSLKFVDAYLKDAVLILDGVENIKEATKEISLIYDKDQLGTSPRSASIPFDSNTYRAAYIYRFFLCNEAAAEYSWRLFIENANFRRLILSLGKINFVSLGGGPATDLFAFCRVLKKYGYSKQINADIFDSCIGWAQAAARLFSFNEPKEVVPNYDFFQFQFLKPIESDLVVKLQNADIVSLVKFVSCVEFDEERAVIRLKECIQQLKKGCYIFFMDNSGGKSVKIMTTAARDSGLAGEAQLIHQSFEMPSQTMSAMHQWEIQFGRPPQSKAYISAYLWKKTT